MSAKVILCYSYKGGAGRTTGAINIAASFIKLKKNVCIIDLDIENPGLHEILDLKKSNITPKSYIQHLIRTRETDAYSRELIPPPISLEKYLKEGVINNKDLPLEGASEISKSGCEFLFLPASVDPKDFITLKGRYAENTLKKLFKSLEEKYNIDFIIIDGASGLNRNTSILPMAISDVILLFFKWSKQHLAGTLFAYKWLNTFKDNPKTNFKAEILLVPSGIPEIDHDSSESTYLTGIQLAAQEKLLNETGIKPKELYNFEIKDNPLLRWNEKIIVFEQPNSNYENIAKYLDENLVNDYE